MNWAVEVSATAEKELNRLPRDRQRRVEIAIDEMEHDPFAGDVKPLKGPD
jgi:mRNA-degrading endonuclease RelE of RelBE toxin-antitoxin system